MSNDVSLFVSKCRRDPCAVCPVRTLFRAFGESLPEGKRGAWSRSNFLFELARGGFALGEFAHRDCIVGIAPPRGAWTVRDGKLHFADSAA